LTEVVSVRFKNHGKLYFFDPNGVECAAGDQVVVETAKGLELGQCVRPAHAVTDDRIVPPIRPVVRVATEEDLRFVEANRIRAKEAKAICRRKIAEHGLEMKLVDVEYNFEGNKIIFYFTSEGRVDFRELVKDLASVFRMRIELRQIGVRDEAKMLGGLGICGKPFCCAQFLDDFQPVSTKMAKTQSLPLNPTKISGSCGRLMCCLRYEQEAYEDLVKNAPKNGAYVNTPVGPGSVEQVQLLRQRVKVRIDGPGEQVSKTYDLDEIAVVPGGRPKPGEPPRELPKVVAKVKKEPEPENTLWPRLIEDVESEEKPKPAPAETPEQTEQKKPRKRRRGGKGHSGSQRAAAEQKPQSVEAQKPAAHKTEGAEKRSGSGAKRSGRHYYHRRKPKGDSAAPKQ